PRVAAERRARPPFIIARAIRRRVAWRERGLTIAVAAVAFVLGGGVVYAINFAHARDKASAIGATPNFVGYGDWANLWQFPYLALAEPFSRNPSFVWVPWRHENWFWPRYEVFFSGFGPLFTLLACSIPYSVFRFRDKRPERLVFCTSALIASFLIMPLQFRPLGFFGGLPRFIAFVVPAVMAFSIAPIVVGMRLMAARLTILALTMYFCVMAFQSAKY